jgi:hypothetical protein
MTLIRTVSLLLVGFLMAMGPVPASAAEKGKPRTVGVLFVVHGGSEDQDVANTFDSTLQFFQYDPNNVIFKTLIWNQAAWPTVVKSGDSQSYANAATQLKKYQFAQSRIGGTDPAPELTDKQFARMQKALKRAGRKQDIRFVSDIAQWIGTQEQTNRLPWPRYLYEPKVPGGARLTYCGSAADGGPWPGCNPERYNVDGPAERLLRQGADEIVMVDMTVGGTRFWKTYDVVNMTRRVVADWNQRNGTAVPRTGRGPLARRRRTRACPWRAGPIPSSRTRCSWRCTWTGSSPPSIPRCAPRIRPSSSSITPPGTATRPTIPRSTTPSCWTPSSSRSCSGAIRR